MEALSAIGAWLVSRRRLVAWVVGGALVVVMADRCVGAPVCDPGSLKGERGETYYCRDSDDGPRWVRQ